MMGPGYFISTPGKFIATGYANSFIINTSDYLVACGKNDNGQLGMGDYSSSQTYLSGTNYVKKHPNGEVLTNVKSVSAGMDHTLILDGSGLVYVCGSNEYGQLGLGTGISNRNLATQLPNITDVKKVSAGANHSMVLKNDGTVYGFGMGYMGQLGTNTGSFTPIWMANGVSDIAAGGSYSLILKGNILYGVGANDMGQLGCGHNPIFSFTEIATNVASFTAGYDHTVIQKTDGTFWACGNNDYGQLGDGTTNSTCNWVQVLLPVNNIFPDPSKWYKITNLNSNKVLQPQNTSQGSNVVQIPYTGTSNQLWKFVPGNLYYNIVNQSSGYYMDIYQGRTDPGAANIVWPANGGRNQNRTLIDAGSGNYNIQNQNSGLNLDINGGSTADGAQDIQWTPHTDNNQKWQISDVTASQYTITASAGANGSISPSGSVQVNSGSSQTFTITPNSGYVVDIVWVNGSSQGSITSYTFTSVTANSSISATFKLPTDPCAGVQGGGGGLQGTTFGLSPSWAAGTEFCKATDGNINSIYDYSQASGGYTGLDLGSAKVVTKIKYYPRTSSEGRMVGGKFQGSNTSSSSGFVDLYTITATPAAQWNEVTISNSTGYRWVHYLGPANGYCNIAEMEFSESSTSFPDPTKWYKIATRANTSLCLDVSSGNYANNTAIQLWTKTNTAQEFKFQSAGNGYSTITCRGNTNYSIDIGGNFANSQQLKLWTTDLNNANQKFKLVPITGGYYRIETSNSGFSIDNWGAGGNGVRPALWSSDNNNTNQHWVITAVP